MTEGPTQSTSARSSTPPDRAVAALSVALLSAGLLTTSACTHWGSKAVYGERREIGRRLVGAPQVAQTNTSDASLGFYGASVRDRGLRLSEAELSGSHVAVSRTHCIQQAEIDYQQPYDLVATPVGRDRDLVGGVAIAAAGLTTMVVAKFRSDTVFEPGDALYEKPPDPTAGYLLGGGLVLGGIGLIWHSHANLPSGPPPATRSGERRWTEVVFVEATGCGLVPGDAARP